MVFKLLDGDWTFRKQLRVIVEFAGGDSARSLFLHRGPTRRAETQVEVCGGNGGSITGKLKKENLENRKCRLPPHYTFRRGGVSQPGRLGKDELPNLPWC